MKKEIQLTRKEERNIWKMFLYIAIVEALLFFLLLIGIVYLR